MYVCVYTNILPSMVLYAFSNANIQKTKIRGCLLFPGQSELPTDPVLECVCVT